MLSGARMDFALIANMSHELRTPLTIIRGYADVLEQLTAEDVELFQEATEAIKTSAENMQELIESVLFLARADQNNLPLRKFPLEVNELLKAVVESYKNSRLEFVSGDRFDLDGDKFFLERMFREIIDNALNFSEGKVFVRVESDCVKVSDSGIGIAPELHDRIFERFFKADKSRTKKFGAKNSVGLGLSIAKWIAEEHELSIEIQSQLGEGTTVVIEN